MVAKSVRKIGFLEGVYKNKIAPDLAREFSIKNPHLVPYIEKVVVSMRLGRDAADKAAIEAAGKELSLITGRKPAFSKAKKSIAGFKLRQGQVSGVFCTLRRDAAYRFLERLIYVALPRIKDFRGFQSKSFDAHKNLSFGISDHLIFQEVSYDSINRNRGLDVSIVIRNAVGVDMALRLLQSLNFPIRK